MKFGLLIGILSQNEKFEVIVQYEESIQGARQAHQIFSIFYAKARRGALKILKSRRINFVSNKYTLTHHLRL
jgi:hypothetical protein